MENPYLRSTRIGCLGRRNLGRIRNCNRLRRHVSFRRHGFLCSPVLPAPSTLSTSSSAPATCSPQSPLFALNPPTFSAKPSLSDPLSPAPIASPMPSPLTTEPPQPSSGRPPIIERLHRDIERREKKQIVELEEEVRVPMEANRELKSELMEMRRRRHRRLEATSFPSATRLPYELCSSHDSFTSALWVRPPSSSTLLRIRISSTSSTTLTIPHLILTSTACLDCLPISKRSCCCQAYSS